MSIESAPSVDQAERDALLLMQRLGGSFAAPLAEAWLRADPTNKAKLRATFPDLLAEYVAMGSEVPA